MYMCLYLIKKRKKEIYKCTCICIYIHICMERSHSIQFLTKET